MDQNNRRRFETEYREFLESDLTTPPRSVSESVVKLVRQDLNPAAASVFMKLLSIHIMLGVATLAICPQFGHSLTKDMGLMHAFMKLGTTGCMLACGALFTGTSLLVASLVLKPEEVRVIKRKSLLQVASLAILSLGVFVCFGSEVIATLGSVWILGAIVGGVGTLELGWVVRKKVMAWA